MSATTQTTILVDDLALLNSCLGDLCPTSETLKPTKLAIDVEGVDLCREGKISILQIWANTSSIIWLVDITVLGSSAFHHIDDEGRTLKGVLEDRETSKLLYDVRNDSDALWNLHQIDLANVYDLQLLDLAVRGSNLRPVAYVNGLAKSIDFYLNTSAAWRQVKEAGQTLFLPAKGGSYEVFEQRPLDSRLILYCAQDVSLLFRLESSMEQSIGHRGSNWKTRVLVGSARRVAEAKSAIYAGHGRHRAIAPAI